MCRYEFLWFWTMSSSNGPKKVVLYVCGAHDLIKIRLNQLYASQCYFSTSDWFFLGEKYRWPIGRHTLHAVRSHKNSNSYPLVWSLCSLPPELLLSQLIIGLIIISFLPFCLLIFMLFNVCSPEECTT